jgi:hypothetical protein
VRRALIRYARWLRENYTFPIRVPVYLLRRPFAITKGERGVAVFVSFSSRTVEPYIGLATGDFVSLRKQRSRDDCLASYILSLSHEVVHYQQWIATGRSWERGVSRKAVAMLRRYNKTVDHP